MDKKAQKLKGDLGLKSNDDLLAFLLDSQNVKRLREEKEKINKLHADKREDERIKKDYRQKQIELLEKNAVLESKVEQLNGQLEKMEKFRSALESCKQVNSDLEEKLEKLSSNEIIGKYADLEAKFVESEKQRKNAMNKCDLLEEHIDAMKEPKKLYDENQKMKRLFEREKEHYLVLYEKHKKLASQYSDFRGKYDRLFDVHFRTRKSRRKKQ